MDGRGVEALVKQFELTLKSRVRLVRRHFTKNEANAGANYTGAHSVQHKLSRLRHSKLRHDSLPMRFRRLLTNIKQSSDFLDRLAFANDLQHSPFAKRQRIGFARDAFCVSFREDAMRGGIQINDSSANNPY